MNLFKNKNNVITYTVNKNNYNDLYISVQNGEVIINAPWYMAASQIQKIVEEKKKWIMDKVKEYNAQKKELNEYSKIETVKVFGQDFDLAIKYKFVEKIDISVDKDKILVILPYKYKKMEKEKLVSSLIEKMYNLVAENEIEKTMEKVRLMLNLAPEDYEIKRMKNRLGLCDNEKIFINPDIVQFSKETIEYIIIHEFCHLKYKNHTKSFYNMLKTYFVNYEELDKKMGNYKY